jgi:hypothetical protein
VLPATIDLSAYRGDSWAQPFRLKQGTTPVNLSGATIKSEARAMNGVKYNLPVQVDDPVNGQLQIRLPSGSLPPAPYDYDIEVTISGVVTTWVRGRLTVDEDVSNELPTTP